MNLCVYSKFSVNWSKLQRIEVEVINFYINYNNLQEYFKNKKIFDDGIKEFNQQRHKNTHQIKE